MKHLFCLLCLFILLACHSLLAEKNPFSGFIENKGQWHTSVLYKKKVPNGFLFLQNRGWTYYLSNAWEDPTHAAASYECTSGFEESAAAATSQVISVQFEGANDQPDFSSLQSKSYYHNFFLGSDESHWASRVQEYDEIQYCDLYERVDLKIYTLGGGMKYDLEVHPGGDPSSIVMDWKGGGEVYLSEGNLIVETEFGKIEEHKPWAYQLVKGDTIEVPVEFAVSKNKVSFSLPEGYNETETLVIDPLLIFSTYSGSTADNWGNTATFGENGTTYAGGIIFGASTGQFVPSPGVFQQQFKGEFDVVLMKFDSTGSDLLFATYLGDDFAETPISLIMNSANDLVVMGTTSSPDFPVTANVYDTEFGEGTETAPFGNEETKYLKGSDLFVSIVSSDGTQLRASTFLGGSANDGMMGRDNPLVMNYGDQFRGEVNIDENDNIYIATNTESSDIFDNDPLYPFGGGTDGLLIKMNKELSQLIWGTYVGGVGEDALFSVKPDQNGGLFAAGGTQSNSFSFGIDGWQKNKADSTDGFIVHIEEATQTIDHATYLGSDDHDQAYLLDLDVSGRVYVIGQTKGAYPLVGNVYRNEGSGQFLQKLSGDLSSTEWSTVFGSGTMPSNISPTAFLVSDCNQIYIAGWGGGPQINEGSPYFQGNTQGLPLTANAFQTVTDGRDFYLMVLEPDAAGLLYGTYFGGSPSSDHVDGGTSRFDKRGVVHHAVCAGCGQNISNFTTTDGAWSEVNNSPNCNLGVFKFDLSTLSASFSTNTPDQLNPDVEEGCAPFTFLFTNNSVGGENHFWSMGDGTYSSNSDTVIHTYSAPGEYEVSLRVTNPNTCKSEDIVKRKVMIKQGTYTISPSATICYGDEVQLEATGGTSYSWLPNGAGLNSSAVANPVASPRQTTEYYVTITNDLNRCTFVDSVTVTVLEEIKISSRIEPVYNCEGLSEFDFSAAIEGSEAAHWDFGDGTQTTVLSGTHSYQTSGEYRAQLVAPNELCEVEVNETLTSSDLVIPNIFTPNGDGLNDRFEVLFHEPLQVTIIDRNGKTIVTSPAYTNQWDGADEPAGVYYYEVVLPDLSSCNGWVHLIR